MNFVPGMATFSQLRLETPRLHLRAPCDQDLDDLFAIYSAWTDRQQTQDWLQRVQAKNAQSIALTLALEHKPTRQVIGSCSLFKIDPDERCAEIAYALNPDWYKQGLMHEALVAVISHAFGPMQLQRIVAYTEPTNTASVRVLERLDFERGSHHPGHFNINSNVTDADRYDLLHDQWRNTSTSPE